MRPDGMSGAIVEGTDRYVPAVRGLRERVLVLRGRDIEHDSEAAALRRRVEIAQTGGLSFLGQRPVSIFRQRTVFRPVTRAQPN
jgi:hypothetical protein